MLKIIVLNIAGNFLIEGALSGLGQFYQLKAY